MKSEPQLRRLVSGISAALLTLGLSVSAVQAQTADDSDQHEDEALETEAEGVDPDIEWMVVTGSRIKSDSTLDSVSPVVGTGVRSCNVHSKTFTHVTRPCPQFC